jgi:hypothetical protein
MSAEIELMATIDPPRGVWVAIWLATAWTAKNAPFRLMSCTRRQREWGRSRKAWKGHTPALETRTSIREKVETAAATIWRGQRAAWRRTEGRAEHAGQTGLADEVQVDSRWFVDERTALLFQGYIMLAASLAET